MDIGKHAHRQIAVSAWQVEALHQGARNRKSSRISCLRLVFVTAREIARVCDQIARFNVHIYISRASSDGLIEQSMCDSALHAGGSPRPEVQHVRASHSESIQKVFRPEATGTAETESRRSPLRPQGTKTGEFEQELRGRLYRAGGQTADNGPDRKTGEGVLRRSRAEVRPKIQGKEIPRSSSRQSIWLWITF